MIASVHPPLGLKKILTGVPLGRVRSLANAGWKAIGRASKRKTAMEIFSFNIYKVARFSITEIHDNHLKSESNPSAEKIHLISPSSFRGELYFVTRPKPPKPVASGVVTSTTHRRPLQRTFRTRCQAHYRPACHPRTWPTDESLGSGHPAPSSDPERGSRNRPVSPVQSTP
jgi:hypothetical protein